MGPDGKTAPHGAPEERPLLGRVLVDAGIITEAELERALALRAAWDVPLGQAVLSLSAIPPRDFYSALAQHLGLPFVDLSAAPPDAARFEDGLLDFYLAAEAVPVADNGTDLTLATPDPLHAAETLARFRTRWRDAAVPPTLATREVSFAITSRLDVLWSVQGRFEADLLTRARDGLDLHDPVNSARSGLSWPQQWGFAIGAVMVIAGFLIAPLWTGVTVNLVLAAFFMAVIGLRAASIPIGVAARAVTGRPPALPAERDLPVYTILVPLYSEAHVLPLLAEALHNLDYPRAKLDIKLILEADDRETIEAAKALGLEGNVEFIRVPTTMPRTKPKACNYALTFARGDYVVIFDAEDQPEPLQLKKAVAAFAKAKPDVACVQAALSYFNADENWLTRQFTIEFGTWFDLFLPMLDRLGMPIPLGGTSTHFRIEVLREVGAWDPFNVTEDADLGIRLAQKGYRCAVLDSVTYEEANCQTGNWVRQRSRWLKGYMQTWAVHMRRPGVLWNALGPVGFIGFHLTIGGSIVSALTHPIVWLLAAGGWLLAEGPFAYLAAPGIPLALVILNLTMLTTGYLVALAAGAYACHIRGLDRLMWHAPFMLIYWPLISVAAYKAVGQIVTRPFFWEKTRHAISRASLAQLARLANRQRDGV